MDRADLISRARAFAIQAHGEQLYGDQPYSVHLAAVVQVLRDFGVDDPEMLAAGWLHDAIEDAGKDQYLLAIGFGVRVARLVGCVSGKGRSRRQRVRSIYEKIARCPEAAILKCADRIANVEASAPGSRSWHMYANEQLEFSKAIKPHVPEDMWARLEAAFQRSAVA